MHYRMVLAISALSLGFSNQALSNEVDNMVLRASAQDVPVISDYLKAEEGKGNVEGNFYVDPISLEIYVNAKARGEHPGSPSALDNARKWGHQFCKDMSKSQHDRSWFLAWHINVMAWQGPEDGGPNSGYDPVYKCTLGGETAIPIAAKSKDYLR